jgi:hypothetical protein
VAVPATASTAPGCARPGRPHAENTRPRLDRCSAHRIRPDRSHRPRSRPVFGPPLRQLASDPFHPVEGGSANDYEYCSGDPVNCTDLSGRERFDVYDIDPDIYDPWFAFYFPGRAAEAYFRGTILAGRPGFARVRRLPLHLALVSQTGPTLGHVLRMKSRAGARALMLITGARPTKTTSLLTRGGVSNGMSIRVVQVEPRA